MKRRMNKCHAKHVFWNMFNKNELFSCVFNLFPFYSRREELFQCLQREPAKKIQKAQQHYFLSIHSSLFVPAHTWWCQKNCLFHFSTQNIYRFSPSSNWIFLSREFEMWIKYCMQLCFANSTLETGNWKPRVINIMMEFNRKMMHHLIISRCIQMKPSCWQSSS